MKNKTNKELLQYDEFWKNNTIHDIRYIVNKFIKDYEKVDGMLKEAWSATDEAYSELNHLKDSF